MGTDRPTVTSAPDVTRRAESWPIYNVRSQCLVTGASIIAIVVAIMLIVIL